MTVDVFLYFKIAAQDFMHETYLAMPCDAFKAAMATKDPMLKSEQALAYFKSYGAKMSDVKQAAIPAYVVTDMKTGNVVDVYSSGECLLHGWLKKHHLENFSHYRRAGGAKPYNGVAFKYISPHCR